jgi:DNA-binding Lrp family transcriptional regulator
MSKTSKDQILQDEIKVLDALEQHSKDSVDEIAKSCGFSRQKVWRIIKELEKRKIIWGYTAITDGELRDFKHYVLLVKRNTFPFEESLKKEIIFEKIDAYAPDSVKIENIFFTYGSFDVVLTFYAVDLVNAKKFIQIAFKKLEKYIGDYLLLETLVPIRKQGIKNPQIKKLIEYI